MGSKFFKSGYQQRVKVSSLEYQLDKMQERYEFLKFRFDKKVLVGTGWIESPDYVNKYKFEMRCVAGKEPYVKILEPDTIVPSREIHMYDDLSLCLHYPPDMKWSWRTPLFQYTVPWIFEWAHYYEMYLINGFIWEGPESPVHFTDADRNVKDDTGDIF